MILTYNMTKEPIGLAEILSQIPINNININANTYTHKKLQHRISPTPTTPININLTQYKYKYDYVGEKGNYYAWVNLE